MHAGIAASTWATKHAATTLGPVAALAPPLLLLLLLLLLLKALLLLLLPRYRSILLLTEHSSGSISASCALC
jgi:hypothetical protein